MDEINLFGSLIERRENTINCR